MLAGLAGSTRLAGLSPDDAAAAQQDTQEPAMPAEPRRQPSAAQAQASQPGLAGDTQPAATGRSPITTGHHLPHSPVSDSLLTLSAGIARLQFLNSPHMRPLLALHKNKHGGSARSHRAASPELSSQILGLRMVALCSRSVAASTVLAQPGCCKSVGSHSCVCVSGIGCIRFGCAVRRHASTTAAAICSIQIMVISRRSLSLF